MSNIDKELNVPYEKSKYKKFPYSKQIEDFGSAHVRLVYNNGTIIESLSKHYKNLDRTNMKSASVVSESDKIIFTLDIVNDKLIYRLRNIVPPIQDQKLLKEVANKKYGKMLWNNPKRAFILATEGKIVFVWDSGQIKEITEWSKQRPYDKPILRSDEK